MFARASRWLFWGGGFAGLFGATLVVNASAVYLEGDEWKLLLILVGCTLILVSALLMRWTGQRRREALSALNWRQRGLLFTGCLLGLGTVGWPTLDAQMQLKRYGITTDYGNGGGSLSFIKLRQQGENFCELVSLVRMRFVDMNGDGHADIVFDDASRTVLLYDAALGRFPKCRALVE